MATSSQLNKFLEERRKYIAELEAFSVFPDDAANKFKTDVLNDERLKKDVKELLFFIFFRLFHLIHLVLGNSFLKNRFVPEAPNIFNLEYYDGSTTDEFFDHLMLLPIDIRRNILMNIEVQNSAIYDRLVNAATNENKEDFVTIVHENELNLKEVAKLTAFLHEFCLFKEYAEDKDNNIKDTLDFAGSVLKHQIQAAKKLIPLHNFTQRFIDFWAGVTNLKNDDEFLVYLNKYGDYLIEAYDCYKWIVFIYWDLINNFDNDECEVIDKFLKEDPERLEKLKEEYSEVVEFHLPKDFSKMKPDESKNHFYSHKSFFLKMPNEKFEKLANYFAQNSFIEDNNKTKRLFIYRLTGRWRPENLEKIKWKDPTTNSRNLLFLAHKIVKGINEKYELVGKFFDTDLPDPEKAKSFLQKDGEVVDFLKNLDPKTFGTQK